jgi:hypothetical protein
MRWVRNGERNWQRDDGAVVKRMTDSNRWQAHRPDGSVVKSTCGRGIKRFVTAQSTMRFLDQLAKEQEFVRSYAMREFPLTPIRKQHVLFNNIG